MHEVVVNPITNISKIPKEAEVPSEFSNSDINEIVT